VQSVRKPPIVLAQRIPKHFLHDGAEFGGIDIDRHGRRTRLHRHYGFRPMFSDNASHLEGFGRSNGGSGYGDRRQTDGGKE
jgi:hypothetical protein